MGHELSRSAVSQGYASLMGRFALPLLLTQTFENRTHPEVVGKAHRYFLNLFNRELHGNHWKRRGVIGCQSVLGIERHKSGWPHSHAVIGHPDIDLAAQEFASLRRSLKLESDFQWGWSKLEVAKSAAHANAYVSKYIVKEGEIVFSAHLAALATGQLSLLRRTECASIAADLRVLLEAARGVPVIAGDLSTL